MPTPMIKAEGLSKKYRIGSRESYYSFRDLVSGLAIAPIRRLMSFGGSGGGGKTTDLWALKEVSFEVQPGEVMGIIGSNGAGKSTLLKILAGVTDTTEGQATIRGRVGALLEVGTGFHPELTGRENIFLMGAILGMTRQEIRARFDEIVEFSGVGKFLDTPAKRYSSGMWVRLGFAVAAHLQPEILLVDEVLAVGDTEFQKKCLGKMDAVAHQGRTVLFVSHNMAAVNRLCHRAVWLQEGRAQMIDAAEKVVAAYLASGAKTIGQRRWDAGGEAPGNKKIRLRAASLRNSEGQITTVVERKASFRLEIEYEILELFRELRVGFLLTTADGTIAFCSHDSEAIEWQGKARRQGRYTSVCEIPGCLLNSGPYQVIVIADVPWFEEVLRHENALRFSVEDTGSQQVLYHDTVPGVVRPSLKWRVSGP